LNSFHPVHVLPIKAPIAPSKIGERPRPAKKRSNKIEAGSHSRFSSVKTFRTN
jgi:hypothetical protein